MTKRHIVGPILGLVMILGSFRLMAQSMGGTEMLETALKSSAIGFNTAFGNPPGAAILLSPSGSISIAKPTYVWKPVPSAAWYQLWVDDSSSNYGKIKTWYTAEQAGCPSGSGACSVTPTTLLASGDAKWWIQTWNDAGYGPWSAPLSFKVGLAVTPEKAVLVSPSGNISTDKPTYVWNAAPSATWYQLWVNDSGNSAGKIRTWYTAAQAGCASGSGTCSVTPTTLLASGDAKWWIQTWNDAGYGPWSEGMAFSVTASGDKWEIVDAGFQGTDNISGIGAYGNLVFVNVYNSGIYRSQDGGTTFTRVLTESGYNNVLVHDANIAWAQGDFAISKTTDGGSTWTASPVDSWPDKNTICKYGASVLYTAAWEGAIWKSIDGGNSWQVSRSYTSAEHLFGSAAPSASVAYIGGFIASGEIPVIFKTTDGGKSWSKVYQGVDGGGNLRIMAPDPQTVYGVGKSGLIIKTIDGGATWSRLTTPTNGYLLNIARHSSGSIYVSGVAGIILRSDDDGGSWTQEVTGVTVNLEGLAVSDDFVLASGIGVLVRKRLGKTTTWSEKILFTLENKADRDIWVMDSNGNNPKALIQWAGSNEWNPKVSHDGTKLGFISNKSGQYQIWIANIDGSNPVKLTNSFPTNWDFAWSPDDQYIYFAEADGPDSAKTSRIKVDGTNYQVLINYASRTCDNRILNDLDPVAGRYLLYTQDHCWNPSSTIWKYDLQTSTQTVVLDGSINRGHSYFNFSPDASKIVGYIQNSEGYLCSGWDLHVMNQDGSNRHAITSVNSLEGYREPKWSPDGTKIIAAYFTSNCDDAHAFYTMNADGTGRQLLYSNQTAKISTPFWAKVKQSQSLTQGLVAYYPLDGNANDESGNGNNGEVYGTTMVKDRFGGSDRAIKFNGSDQYIEIPNTSQLHLRSAFTVCAWFRVLEPNNDTTIISKHLYYYRTGYGIGIAGYQARFYVDDGQPLNGIDTDEDFPDQKWHFLVGVFDGSEQRLYVDGQLRKRQQALYSTTNGVNLTIGCSNSYYGGYAGFFKGEIDDIRIYSRALSEEDIAKLYHENGW